MSRIVIVGGSDAGIGAALRIRELDDRSDVHVVLDDAYPNFSICGIPYYVSGDVSDWRRLAHRDLAALEATGMRLHLDTSARRIDPDRHELLVTDKSERDEVIGYDELIIATGATPIQPAIDGLGRSDSLGVADGVHLLHSIGDTLALVQTLESRSPESVLIVGAGYIGLEMAEALTARGLSVTQMEQLPEVLPNVDPKVGALVRDELTRHGVEVLTGTAVKQIHRAGERLRVEATADHGAPVTRTVDLVLVVVGVRPETRLATDAGVTLGARGAIAVDKRMRTNLPNLFAAGDCVVTHRRLLGESYLPLGTTAHKQGRIAGENALGGTREFAGSLGTQVVKVFDRVVARTGLRDPEAAAIGLDPLTVESEADDHKAYYPGSHPIRMHVTGDRPTGRLLGVQLFGHLRSRDRKTNRHRRHRHLSRNERRGDQRARPLVYATARQPLGRRPNGSSSVVRRGSRDRTRHRRVRTRPVM